jgi:hypothetical protein
MRKIRKNEKLALMTEKFLDNSTYPKIQDISWYFTFIYFILTFTEII